MDCTYVILPLTTIILLCLSVLLDDSVVTEKVYSVFGLWFVALEPEVITSTSNCNTVTFFTQLANYTVSLLA